MIKTHFSNQVKTNDIGRAKDLAVDLQRRANELATSASNKMANIYGKLDSITTILPCILPTFDDMNPHVHSARVLPIRCGEGVRGDGAASDGALVGVGVAQLRDDDPPAGHRGQVQLLQDVRQRHRVAVHRLLPVRPGATRASMYQQESALLS